MIEAAQQSSVSFIPRLHQVAVRQKDIRFVHAQ